MNGQKNQQHVRVYAMLFTILGMSGDVVFPVNDAIDQQQAHETERGQQRSEWVVRYSFKLFDSLWQQVDKPDAQK